jgi:Undecaprenyl-phosphate galactose phosphotransferase WbaP
MTIDRFDDWYRPRRRRTTSAPITLSFMLGDLLSIMLAFGAGFFVINLVNVHLINFKSFVTYWPYLPAFILVFYVGHLYPGVSMAPAEEIRHFFIGSMFAYAAIILSLNIQQVHDWDIKSLAFGLSMVFSPFFLIVGRSCLRGIICRMDWWGIPAVVFGCGRTGRKIVDRLLDHPKLGYIPVAILDDDDSLPDEYRGVPILRGTSRGPELVDRYGLRTAIIAMPGVERQKVARVVDKCAYPYRHLMLVPDFFGMTSIWMSVRDFGGVLGLASTQRLNLPSNLAAKRFQDLFITVVGGLICLPFIGLIALAVKLDSPGPVLYGHTRLGKNGVPFKAWKFRSMVVDADAKLEAYLAADPERRREWERDFKLKDDPRVTRIGRLLRKTSLDEVPQLINVLKGEMSLVGPRPIVAAEREKYGESYELFSRMTPGMTGLWQVSGRSDTGYEERIALDCFYSQSWSIWLDLYILYKTAGVIFYGKGAY